MSSRRQVRELALQALYQYDARGDIDAEHIERSVFDAPDPPETIKRLAIELAKKAWATREQADALATEFSPDWPTHRQPMVDRGILRLAYYEIASGMTPAAVAINEAVEIAKTFGSERSPAFINGVLDKIAQRLKEVAPTTGEIPLPPKLHDEDQWLKDAIDESRPLS
jgi:transcription antitermination protein NusB